MRWSVPKVTRYSGKERTLTRFAWLPVTVDDGWCVWLERYRVKERMIPTGSPDAVGGLRWAVVERTTHVRTG